MSEIPAVSVLIAVHNGLPYLESALRSIMGQTLQEIEIVVVDDASTDATPEILARLAVEDPRIRVETLKTNLRLPGALNRGLELVRAPLVARMDADDIVHPERLERQSSYMTAHPEVWLVGAGIRQIDASGDVQRVSYRPRDAVQTRWLARFNMPLMHPTFMFRVEDRNGRRWRYDPRWSVTEDYELLAQILDAGEVVSLSDILLDYRVHPGSISVQRWSQQLIEARQIAKRVQNANLPEKVRQALEPMNMAFLEREPVHARDVFDALEAMLAFDASRAPEYRVWMRRQAAQLAMRALQRTGRGGRAALALAFLGPGRAFLAPLALRAGEVANILPQRLRSDRAGLSSLTGI